MYYDRDRFRRVLLYLVDFCMKRISRTFCRPSNRSTITLPFLTFKNVLQTKIKNVSLSSKTIKLSCFQKCYLSFKVCEKTPFTMFREVLPNLFWLAEPLPSIEGFWRHPKLV